MTAPAPLAAASLLQGAQAVHGVADRLGRRRPKRTPPTTTAEPAVEGA